MHGLLISMCALLGPKSTPSQWQFNQVNCEALTWFTTCSPGGNDAVRWLSATVYMANFSYNSLSEFLNWSCHIFPSKHGCCCLLLYTNMSEAMMHSGQLNELWLFRPFAGSPPDLFAPWLIRPLVRSPLADSPSHPGIYWWFVIEACASLYRKATSNCSVTPLINSYFN